MTLLALADADDARMFRLAGVEAVDCRVERDVAAALSRVTDAKRGARVVLVSRPVYERAAHAIDALRSGVPSVTVLVLP